MYRHPRNRLQWNEQHQTAKCCAGNESLILTHQAQSSTGRDCRTARAARSMKGKNDRLSRRDFLRRATIAAGFLTATPMFGRNLSAEETPRKILHIIGHSHIDAA